MKYLCHADESLNYMATIVIKKRALSVHIYMNIFYYFDDEKRSCKT
jgi:hypothetical protein